MKVKKINYCEVRFKFMWVVVDDDGVFFVGVMFDYLVTNLSAFGIEFLDCLRGLFD